MQVSIQFNTRFLTQLGRNSKNGRFFDHLLYSGTSSFIGDMAVSVQPYLPPSKAGANVGLNANNDLLVSE
jgi:hypothetical protein